MPSGRERCVRSPILTLVPTSEAQFSHGPQSALQLVPEDGTSPSPPGRTTAGKHRKLKPETERNTRASPLIWAGNNMGQKGRTGLKVSLDDLLHAGAGRAQGAVAGGLLNDDARSGKQLGHGISVAQGRDGIEPGAGEELGRGGLGLAAIALVVVADKTKNAKGPREAPGRAAAPADARGADVGPAVAGRGAVGAQAAGVGGE